MDKSNNILTLEGYYTRFNELHAEYRSQRTAWKILENELQEGFGMTRYTSFESLKAARSRMHRTKRQSRDIFK